MSGCPAVMGTTAISRMASLSRSWAPRSAQLLPCAADLHKQLAGRYPGERLVAGYGEAIAELTGAPARPALR